MKLWEALKELEENPKKVFECNLVSRRTAKIYARRGWYQLEFYDTEGKIISENMPAGAFSGNISFEGEWQEVKQPVTWHEAIEAWANGKKIKCECEGCGTFFRPSTVSSACFTAKLITHGTWYIED